MAISKSDRKLASLCGLDLSFSTPFGDTGFFEHLESLRNKAVEAIVRDEASKSSTDPLSEDAGCDFQSPLKKLRRELLEDSPMVLEIQLEGRAMRVLSAVRNDTNVKVELTCHNLEHIIHCIRSFTEKAHAKKRNSGQYLFDFKGMGCPDVKWKSDRGAIYVDIRNAEGRMKKKFITPKKSDVEQIWRDRVREAAGELQQVFNELNHPIEETSG